jgi:hypothetical protein
MTAAQPRDSAACYRARQFFAGLAAHLKPLSAADRAEAHAGLPVAAWPLFDAMPRNDQRHSLRVLRTLRAAGRTEPALLQAGLLHDAAKTGSGLTLLHRAAVVLLRAFWPGPLARWATLAEPSRRDPRYPFWAHINHPARGAELAAAAGCDPLAAALIRRHQDEPSAVPDAAMARLLRALQAADDDN